MMSWLPWLAWALGSYNLLNVTNTAVDPQIARVEYRFRAGSNPLNEFSIVHVHRSTCSVPYAPVILMSPFLLPGSFYEIAETGAYAQSVAGRLAADGYDLWLVDQRRSHLAPGTCEQGLADCSAMATWDFETLSNDGLLAVAMAKALNPTKKPIVGGFSAGSNAAMALINRFPNEVAGAFLYEGTFYTDDPTIMAHNGPICQQLETAIGNGNYYDPSAQLYTPLLALAQADPSGASPFPMFPPGTTNQQAMLYVFSAPPPAGALSPTPTFTRCIADFSTQSFVYTNPQRLFLAGPKFDNYASIPAMRDLACGLAGLDAHYYDHLDAFRGNVLIYVEGTGFGPALFDTASLFTHAKSVTVNHHPELGEADPYFHSNWQQVFYAPLRQWLAQVTAAP
jgi:pimeloyl-ACP methyl ester carboxylesterase